MRKIFIIIGCLLCVQVARSQSILPGLQLQELIRINEVYTQIPYLSFNVQFQYRDTLSQPIPDEQVNAVYKLNQGRFWAQLDSTEMVQGYNYFITAYHDDSIISISPVTTISQSLLTLPVLDSVYRQNFLDSISVFATNDTIRRLTLHFGSLNPSTFQLFYKSSTYLIDSIKYSYPMTDTVGTNYITAKFSAYSTAAIPEQYFLESKFISRDGAQFFLKPSYSTYELMVNGDFGQAPPTTP